jgi:hypothetical protein
LEIPRISNYCRYTIIKVENRESKKIKDYGTIGQSMSDVIEALLNYYEKREGKPQKRVKV